MSIAKQLLALLTRHTLTRWKISPQATIQLGIGAYYVLHRELGLQAMVAYQPRLKRDTTLDAYAVEVHDREGWLDSGCSTRGQHKGWGVWHTGRIVPARRRQKKKETPV